MLNNLDTILTEVIKQHSSRNVINNRVTKEDEHKYVTEAQIEEIVSIFCSKRKTMDELLMEPTELQLMIDKLRQHVEAELEKQYKEIYLSLKGVNEIKRD